jgi:membrane protein implicated in regulation of membrane protease activity
MEISIYMPWIWLSLGIILIVLELVLPGLVSIFFGFSGVILGTLLLFGLTISIPWQVFLWILLSGILILLLRKQVAGIFPSLEKHEYRSEDDDIIGQWVEVIEDVHEGDSRGRVRFQGSTWSAKSEGGTIPSGSIAYIRNRKNLTLLLTSDKPE